MLEIRPVGGGGKGAAVAALLAADGFAAAAYAGDDRTDLDAFRRLRELREDGELETAICIGVSSAEAPPELAEESDLSVDGPAGWLAMLEDLAALAVPYTDLLRLSVFLTAGEATALGAIAAIAAGPEATRDDPPRGRRLVAGWQC